MDAKEYMDASLSFEKTKAYKHLIIAYEKQGLYSKALSLADEKRYYELGAKICLHINDLKQAAYFYSYFDPVHAAKLYRNLYCYYEAGYCYLSNLDPLNAIDMFRRCSDKTQRVHGLKEVSDYALVLYFSEAYESAFRIFLALDDYYSALECAQRMKEDKLIASCRLLIGYEEAEKCHYHFAAQCIEPFAPKKALIYYAKAGNYKEQVRLLLATNDYKKAIQVCLLHNDLNEAYQIASSYDPELLNF
ncbi:MAG: hypothetical protein H9872_05010 [Candidatus Cellulosilyticum pullistercoris]|uniref:Uncharacterized protein n=1 Tax=Candidatus Cellulosilyticum pullistercoris TaxID=2838521 RepID=A0A9E2KCV9_9FIRM|nr:hypothetical protein [Candidatus Cellulosilyticum pullistercoris]